MRSLSRRFSALGLNSNLRWYNHLWCKAETNWLHQKLWALEWLIMADTHMKKEKMKGWCLSYRKSLTSETPPSIMDLVTSRWCTSSVMSCSNFFLDSDGRSVRTVSAITYGYKKQKGEISDVGAQWLRPQKLQRFIDLPQACLQSLSKPGSIRLCYLH